MSDENKKRIKVKMRVVAFSDLPKMKEYSFRSVNVGEVTLGKQKKDLEREGKESIV